MGAKTKLISTESLEAFIKVTMQKFTQECQTFRVNVDADPALDARISDAVSELVSYYADVDLPPVVQRLAQLVAERDYKTVRDEVDDIWNQLLRYHKQKKLRPKPSLTTTFNTIHAIVREM